MLRLEEEVEEKRQVAQEYTSKEQQLEVREPDCTVLSFSYP